MVFRGRRPETVGCRSGQFGCRLHRLQPAVYSLQPARPIWLRPQGRAVYSGSQIRRRIPFAPSSRHLSGGVSRGGAAEPLVRPAPRYAPEKTGHLGANGHRWQDVRRHDCAHACYGAEEGSCPLPATVDGGRVRSRPCHRATRARRARPPDGGRPRRGVKILRAVADKPRRLGDL